LKISAAPTSIIGTSTMNRYSSSGNGLSSHKEGCLHSTTTCGKNSGNQVPQHTYSQTRDSCQTQRGKPPLVQSKQNERKRKDQHNNKILKHLKTPPNPTLTEYTDPSNIKTAGQNHPEAQPTHHLATQPEPTPKPTL
jgi:hypothetical protein